MERSIKNNSPYLPTLDGWRAIAILAVIFHHDAVHTAGVFNTRWLYEYGNAGVDLFFAISGLLICTRLLAEEASYGRICLGQFYLRRCLRILPPALVYLATIAILGSMSVISVGVADWWSSLLFCRNYPDLLGSTHGVTGWYTSHFWSLSLEEQFYLGLPALLALIPKDHRATVIGILAAGVFADRFLVLSSHPWLQVQFHVGVRMDALLVPALFAVLASEPQRKAWMRRSLRFWPLIAACLLLMVPLGKGSAWHVSLLVWLMPCIVLGSVLNPENAIGRLLEWSPLRWMVASRTVSTSGSNCSSPCISDRAMHRSGGGKVGRLDFCSPARVRLAVIFWWSAPFRVWVVVQVPRNHPQWIDWEGQNQQRFLVQGSPRLGLHQKIRAPGLKSSPR